MPTYEITAPDGKTYRIDGPDGASDDDVIAAVLAQHPDAGSEPLPKGGSLFDGLAEKNKDQQIKVEDQRPGGSEAPGKFLGATGEQWKDELTKGAGNIVEGVINNTVGMLANPVNATINAIAGTNLHTDLGGATAESTLGAEYDDTLSGAAQRGIAGGLSMAGLSKMLGNLLPGIAGTAFAEVGATPLADAVSGGASELAAKYVEELGAGPVAQIAASLAAGGTTYAGFRKAFNEAGGIVRATPDGDEIFEMPDGSTVSGRFLQDVEAGRNEGLTGSVSDTKSYGTLTPEEAAQFDQTIGQAAVSPVDRIRNRQSVEEATPAPVRHSDDLATEEELVNYKNPELTQPIKVWQDKDIEEVLRLRQAEQTAIRDEVPVVDRTPEERAIVNTDPVTNGPSEDLLNRFTEALKGAARLTNEQKKLYSQERAKRFARGEQLSKSSSGEEGLRLEKAALKGELEKVEFNSIRDQFSEPEIVSLFEGLKNSNKLSWIESVNARTGLAKMLDGQIPTKSEINNIARVFPNKTVKALLANRSTSQKLLGIVHEGMALPRALMSTMDVSAPLRQGVFLVGRKEFWKSFAGMYKQFGSEKAHQALVENIRSRPSFELMQQSKLALTEFGHDLSKREEDFMSTWAEKIPGVKNVVRASERAYSGFLNKLRADVFDDIVSKNPDMVNDPDKMRGLAHYINAATGRGDLPGKTLNDAAPLLTNLFFSPRLMASRVQLLNPFEYALYPPEVRKEAMSDLIKFGGTAATVLGLGAAGGMDVETDLRSSDFGKLRSGDTRYDILGGFQQYIRLASQLASGETKTLAGDVRELEKGFGKFTEYDTAIRFLRSKASPIASYMADYLDGQNLIGEPFDPVWSTVERVTPMIVGDAIEAYQNEGIKGVLTQTPFAAHGISVSNIKPKEGKKFDEFGRSRSGDRPEDTPEISEIKGLGGLPEVSGTIPKTKDRPAIKLTPEQKDEYQKLTGEVILDKFTNYTANDPEWSRYSPEYKKEVLDDIAKEARKEVREHLGYR